MIEQRAEKAHLFSTIFSSISGISSPLQRSIFSSISGIYDKTTRRKCSPLGYLWCIASY